MKDKVTRRQGDKWTRKRVDKWTRRGMLVAAASLLLLAGCTASEAGEETASEAGEETVSVDPNLMQFSVLYPSQQEAAAASATRATDTSFEANDRVGIYLTEEDAPLEVSGNYVNNAALTYSGSAWTPDRPIYWNEGTYNVYAYYPYTSPVTSVDNAPFAVATDQSTGKAADGTLGGYEASDFLWASSLGATASNQPVALRFSHRMSCLRIRLIKGEDYEGDLPEDAEVYVLNTVPTATIDLSVGIPTKDRGTTRTIRTKKLGNHAYAAILVPQRIDSSVPLIEVVASGVSYLVETRFTFKMGMQHLISIILSQNPDQSKIEIGGEIEKWETAD